MVHLKNGRWRCRPCERAYQRQYYAANPEVHRERKRIAMAEARHDPERNPKLLESQRRSYAKVGRERQKKHMARLRAEEPFRYRAQLMRHNMGACITTADLMLLWEKQQGLCALSGRQLDILTATIDHIIPKARGGTHEIDNLRWTTPEANFAKRDLLDEEFLTLCKSCIEWHERKRPGSALSSSATCEVSHDP